MIEDRHPGRSPVPSPATTSSRELPAAALLHGAPDLLQSLLPTPPGVGLHAVTASPRARGPTGVPSRWGSSALDQSVPLSQEVTIPVVVMDLAVGPWQGDPGGGGAGRALCEAFVDTLPVAGASISVVTESGSHSVVAASDELAAALEAWQFEAGVGPHWEALRTERPAFLYDVADVLQREEWLRGAAHAVPAGAGALYAFPLQLGAAVVGVADLYSSTPVGGWSGETIARAVEVALSVTIPSVRLATRSADAVRSSVGGGAVELRREVHQATGMVMVQLDCSASDALLRLRGQAFVSGVPLEELARDVIARRINFARL